MKHFFFALALLTLWTVAPAIGQGTTKRLTARSQLSLNVANGEPINGDSTTFAYNSSYQNVEQMNWRYDVALGGWKLAGLSNYTFDANGNRTSIVYQNWDESTSNWINFLRNTNIFDANSLQLSSVQELWNGVDWALDNTTNWIYDTNGNLLSETSDDTRFTHEYNTDGLLVTSTQQMLNNGNWENLYRTLYVYIPGDTKKASSTIEQWVNGAWTGYSRNSYTYDANGDAVVKIEETWTNGAWRNTVKLLSTYDVHHNVVHWVSQSWSGSIWNDTYQMIAEFDDESNVLKARWEYNLGTWQPFIRFGFYYTEFVPTHAPLLTDFQVFPNPASSVLTLKSEGLLQARIFGAKGQLLHAQDLNGQAQETLQLGNLPSGNYFLQVTGKDGRTGAKPLQIRH